MKITPWGDDPNQDVDEAVILMAKTQEQRIKDATEKLTELIKHVQWPGSVLDLEVVAMDVLAAADHDESTKWPTDESMLAFGASEVALGAGALEELRNDLRNAMLADPIINEAVVVSQWADTHKIMPTGSLAAVYKAVRDAGLIDYAPPTPDPEDHHVWVDDAEVRRLAREILAELAEWRSKLS